MLFVYAPHFSAGIDFETKEVAPILRWALALTKEQFLEYTNKKGYQIVATVNGYVERISEKVGKFGPQCGAKIGENWYDLGKTRMGLKEGDTVEFQAEQNARGYWKVQSGTIRPVEAAPSTSTPAPQKATTGAASGWSDNRQDSIVYQSSRKDAIETIKLLNEAGAIDFGKLKGAAKQSYIEAYIDQYTMHYFEEATAKKPFPMQTVEEEATMAKTTRPAPLTEDGDGDDMPF